MPEGCHPSGGNTTFQSRIPSSATPAWRPAQASARAQAPNRSLRRLSPICQHYLGPTLLRANTNWDQHYLGTNTTWDQHYLGRRLRRLRLLLANTTWDQHYFRQQERRRRSSTTGPSPTDRVQISDLTNTTYTQATLNPRISHHLKDDGAGVVPRERRTLVLGFTDTSLGTLALYRLYIGIAGGMSIAQV